MTTQTTQLLLSTDLSGKTTYGIVPSNQTVWNLLTANSVSSFTLPDNFAFYELHFAIDPGLRVWVTYDGSTPVVPGSGSFSSGTQELNPAARVVPGGATVSCITPDTTCQISVSIYAKSSYYT